MERFLRLNLICLCLLTAFLSPTFSYALPRPALQRLYDMPSAQLMKLADRYLYHHHKPDSAMLCYTILADRKGRSSLSRQEKHAAAQAMLQMGYLYNIHYLDYQKAYACLQKALDASKRDGFNDLLPYIYGNMAVISTQEHELGIDNDRWPVLGSLRLAWRSALGNGDYFVAADNFINMGSYAIDYNRVTEIRNELVAFERAKAPRSVKWQYAAQMCKGLQCLLRGENNSALAAFSSQMALADAMDDGARYKLIASDNSARTFFRMGRYAEARRMAADMLQLISREKIDDALPSVNRFVATCYERECNQAMADRWMLRYYKANDSLLRKSRIEYVKYAQFERQIDETRQQMNELALRKARQFRLMVLIACVALVVLGLSYYLYRKNAQLRMKNQMLYKRNAEVMAAYNEKRRLMSPCVKRADGEASPDKDPSAEVKYRGSTLSQEEKDGIFHTVEGVMQSTEEIFSPGFSLTRLSELTGIRYHHLSQVCNERAGSFYGMLSEYRVREACRRMDDRAHYGHLALEAIASSVGFKSRSNFTSVFKRVTGLTPTEYRKISLRNS